MPINRQLEKVVVHMYNGILLSHSKIQSYICNDTEDLECIMLSEISETERVDLLCSYNSKNKQTNKQKT